MAACGGERLFHRESTTRDIGSTISHRLAGNRSALIYYETFAVEDPIYAIFKHLGGQEAIRTKYRFSKLRFSDKSREISRPSDGTPPVKEEDLGKEMPGQQLSTGPSERAASEPRANPRPTNPDGVGVRTRPGGDESVAFVYDYTAAHNVPLKHVKLAIAKETLFMEVIEQMNSTKSRTGAELEQYRAEVRLAMTLTQVFNHMVKYGVAYGYIVAGESLLLLHVDGADPQTLFCYLCVPNEGVGEVSGEDWTAKMIYTAVAQLTSFFLLSIQSDALQGALLEAALGSVGAVLKKWTEPYEDAAHFSAGMQLSLMPSSSLQGTGQDDFTPSETPTGRVVPLRPGSYRASLSRISD